MRRVLYNSALLVGVNFTSAAFGLALSVVIAKLLGLEDFGRYTLGIAWSFALGLFAEFGLNTLLTRDVARRRSDASRYLKAATLIKILLSLLLIAALQITAPQLSHDPSAVLIIRLAAPLILLNSLFGSFTAIFRAFEQMRPILILNAVSSVVQLGLTIALVTLGGGLIGVIVLSLLVQGAELLAAYLIYRARFRMESELGVDWRLIGRLGRAALPFALAGLIAAVQMRASVMLLGAIQNESAVGIFGAASRWAEAAKLVPNAFFGALFPALSFLASERKATLNHTFAQSERALLILAILLAIGLNLAAPPLLTLAYGSAFSPAVPALQILGWLLVPALLNGVTVIYLYALGDETFTNYVGLAGIAVQMAAAIPLISLWGATGAAAAALIGESAMVIPLRWRLETRKRSMPAWQAAT